MRSRASRRPDAPPSPHAAPGPRRCIRQWRSGGAVPGAGAASCRPLRNLLADVRVLFPIARAAARGLAQPGFNGVAPCGSRYPPPEPRDLVETLVLSRMIGPGLSSTTMTACKICPGHLQSSSRSLLHRQLWRSVPFEIRLRFRRVSANRHIFLATPRGYSLTRGRGNAARPPESVARRLCCHVGPKKQMMARDS